jgi:hypothetical protein
LHDVQYVTFTLCYLPMSNGFNIDISTRVYQNLRHVLTDPDGKLGSPVRAFFKVHAHVAGGTASWHVLQSSSSLSGQGIITWVTWAVKVHAQRNGDRESVR